MLRTAKFIVNEKNMTGKNKYFTKYNLLKYRKS